MNFASGFISDLREKRLWPVAAALVIAIVAVPLLMLKSGSPSQTPVVQAPPTTGPATAAVAGVPAVSLSTSTTHVHLNGRARDPFTQRNVPASSAASPFSAGTAVGSANGKAVSAATGSTGTGSATASSGSAASTGSTGSTGSSTASSSSQGASGTTLFTFSVDVKFGKQGHETSYNNLPRLQPLPSAKNPLVIFLGVRNNMRTAVFLVSSDASATGQGTCKPRASNCELLLMKANQQESFLVIDQSGGVSIYNLKLNGIKTTPLGTPEEAKLAHARVSAAGKQLVRKARRHSLGLQSLSYSADTGTVSFHPVRGLWNEVSNVVLESAGACSGVC